MMHVNHPLLLAMTLLIPLLHSAAAFNSPFFDESGAPTCVDSASWCGRLGRRVSLARCYDAQHRARCCATCQRLKLPLPGCEFGDQEDFCSEIGKERPAGDCYAQNKTCCQTCHIYDLGIPGCPFGDRVTWCSLIGDRFTVQSCYDHEVLCCQTCRQLRSHIRGCPYGDRSAWCSGIGIIYSTALCQTSGDTCCHTCHRLREQGLLDVSTSSSTTTTSNLPPITTPRIDIRSTSTPPPSYTTPTSRDPHLGDQNSQRTHPNVPTSTQHIPRFPTHAPSTTNRENTAETLQMVGEKTVSPVRETTAHLGTTPAFLNAAQGDGEQGVKYKTTVTAVTSANDIHLVATVTELPRKPSISDKPVYGGIMKSPSGSNTAPGWLGNEHDNSQSINQTEWVSRLQQTNTPSFSESNSKTESLRTVAIPSLGNRDEFPAGAQETLNTRTDSGVSNPANNSLPVIFSTTLPMEPNSEIQLKDTHLSGAPTNDPQNAVGGKHTEAEKDKRVGSLPDPKSADNVIHSRGEHLYCQPLFMIAALLLTLFSSRHM